MLRAGFARETITPDSRTLSLVGYDFRNQAGMRGNAGVLDDLYIRCLYLNDDEARGSVVLLSIDICVVLNDYANEVRSRVAAALDIPPAQVVIHATHTHSAPIPRAHGRAGPDTVAPLETGANSDEERAYGDTVRERAVTAAIRARGHTVPVDVYHAEGVTALGYNRRVPDVNGGVRMCWSRESQPDLSPRPSPDPVLSVLVLRPRGGGQDFVLWSTGVHPVTLGKTSRLVSADWPGSATASISELLGTDRVLFLQGASGEVHPQLATGDTLEDLSHLARCAAGEVSLLYRRLSPMGAPYGGSGQLDLSCERVELSNSAFEIVGVRVGPVAIVMSPYEVFASIASAIRAEAPGPIIPVNLTNGWYGYLPDTDAWQQGNYEVDIARELGTDPEDSESVSNALRAMAHQVLRGMVVE